VRDGETNWTILGGELLPDDPLILIRLSGAADFDVDSVISSKIGSLLAPIARHRHAVREHVEKCSKHLELRECTPGLSSIIPPTTGNHLSAPIVRGVSVLNGSQRFIEHQQSLGN
jgi:hypothetical protein